MVTDADKPKSIKTATLNEGIDHVVHLCNDYLTDTDKNGTVVCLLVRPLEMTIKSWREVALEWRFSQTTRRNEILSDLAAMSESFVSRNRMHKLGVWE